MSLSRILNNEPSDRQPASAPAGAIDPALMDSSAPSSPSHSASQPPRGSSSNVAVEHPPQPRGLSYQSPPYDGAGGWNPYTGEWMQGGPFPLGRGGNYYDRTREQEREDADGTPESSMASDTGSRTHNGHVEGNGRKRRKTSEQHQHDGVDQAPASQKRVRGGTWVSFQHSDSALFAVRVASPSSEEQTIHATYTPSGSRCPPSGGGACGRGIPAYGGGTSPGIV